jgi:hypothetical protein
MELALPADRVTELVLADREFLASNRMGRKELIINDTLGAFRIFCNVQRHSDGPLAGNTLAVKDLFDVAGFPTGAGSPEWLATHPVPHKSASTVNRLLDAGAHLLGKTHTDELAWSLNGENAHYGTPPNPNAPGRIPGGSSSGSAAAVAGHLVQIAIGTDTGGSVRLPASYLRSMRDTAHTWTYRARRRRATGPQLRHCGVVCT